MTVMGARISSTVQLVRAHSLPGGVARTRLRRIIPQQVIGILQLAHTQFGPRVKRINTDGGTEFINRVIDQWCSSEVSARTILTTTNAAVERRRRELGPIWRRMPPGTLLLHGHTPLASGSMRTSITFGHGIAVNVSPHTGMTPYQLQRGRLPSSLVGFGAHSVAMRSATYPRNRRSALAPKSGAVRVSRTQCRTELCERIRVAHVEVIQTRDVVYRHQSFTFGRAVERGPERCFRS